MVCLGLREKLFLDVVFIGFVGEDEIYGESSKLGDI